MGGLVCGGGSVVVGITGLRPASLAGGDAFGFRDKMHGPRAKISSVPGLPRHVLAS